MPSARVLVVEDDRKTADLVALYLRHAGHTVSVEHTGDRAQARLGRETFDLLVLDVMLPGVDGLALCRKARASGGTAVILQEGTRRGRCHLRHLPHRRTQDTYRASPSRGDRSARIQWPPGIR